MISTVFALPTSVSAEGKTYQYVSLDYETEDSVTGLSTGDNALAAPTFLEQATAKLVSEYGNSNAITYYNIALGGEKSTWGNENLQTRVNVMNAYYGTTVTPDIIYV